MNRILYTLMFAIVLLSQESVAQTLSMSDYKAIPTFVNQTVPPLVLLTMSKDHRLFYKAYNDVMDLDGDGGLDTTYKDTIDYYGYFDSKKCYSYISGNNRFEPQVAAGGTNGHTCSAQWSGNFLNWSTMARIDVVRKVIYGGYRKVDTAAATVLSRTLLPRDAHSWVKVYTPSGGSPAVNTLTPYSYTSISLCNLNTSAAQTSSLVYVLDGAFPYAASTEGRECVSQFQGGGALVIQATLNADVLVCMSSQPEANCEQYGSNWKPNGLMQKLGINRQGTTTTADDVIYMKFALISGSYGAHVGGGVLRSNIVNVNNEIDPATGFVAATSKIISNLNAFKIVQYNYGTGWYDLNANPDRCVPGEPYVLANNQTCKSWGNPMGEMLYEAIRYISGKTTPTDIFQQATPDPGVSGLSVSAWVDPFTGCPECSKVFALMFSDAFPSYDSDHLPGSYWYAAVSPNDIAGGAFNVQTLIDNSGINTLENITASNVYIGESGATNDRSCTTKAGNFKTIRGLCVEEPTKRGAYYMAGLAHYAKTNDLRPDIPAAATPPKPPTMQNLTTYSVVTSSPYPQLEFSAGTNKAQIVPIFHDGCPTANYGSPGYNGCTAQGTGGDNSKGELVDFRLCENDADWTTEQGNGYTSCFDIMWDDAEFGWDYELDIRYRIYVQTTGGDITVRTKGLYAAAGHTDYAGYLISGVSGSGEYYEIACGNNAGAGFSDCDVFNGITSATEAGNATSTRTFSVTGSTAGFLKDPFWYAAKYGGFEDADTDPMSAGYKKPDQQVEWDKDNNGDPDTYFFAASPLKLEAKLTAAFISILNKSSSGTAASVLASSTTGEGALYQSYFFPLKFDPDGRNLHWMGYTQGLFVDTFGNLREDTNSDGRLVYTDDKIVVTQYNSATGLVEVLRYDDANGDGKADTTPPSTTALEQIKPIWEAGKRLALTDSSARHIKTWVDLNGDGVVNDTTSTSTDEYVEFDTVSLSKLTPYLKAGDSSLTATKVINYIRGCEASVCAEQANLRDRRTDLNNGIGSPDLKIWKFGDPVYSTPVIIGAPKERFDVLYGDADYADFYAQYRNRRQVAYVGANDGMLHALNVGTYNTGDDFTTTTKVEHGWFTTSTTTYGRGQNLGDELWAFIPQELLPHLQWLARQDYSHVYYVDLKPRVTDARIFTADADHPGGWGTILIGGFRMGGSCARCTTQAKQVQFSDDFGSGTQTRKFLSAYFVLDITNPEKEPTLLWSFSHDDLGLTTSLPTVVRVRPGGGSKTQSSDEKWFAIFGSGPTNYDGGVAAGQRGKLFVVDMVARKTSSASSTFTVVDAGPDQAFMSDVIALEKDLDFRDDAIYVGETINTGGSPAWQGKLLRLTTNCLGGASCDTNPASWGLTGNIPTDLLQTFNDPDAVPATSHTLGPITLKPAAAIDDRNRLWLFAGSGRYYSTADKTDTSPQYLIGVRDPIMNGSTGTETPWCTGQTSTTSCKATTLADVSNAVVCWLDGSSCIGSGASANQVTNVPGLTVGNFQSLLTLTGSTKQGWFSKLTTSGERTVGSPVVLGGVVFYSTFVPSTDPCVASGNGNLYGLYYVTGTAPSEPIFSGGTPGGTIAKSVSLGQGVTSTPSFHIGQGGVQADIQQSHGGITSVTTSMSGIWSHYISWIQQKD